MNTTVDEERAVIDDAKARKWLNIVVNVIGYGAVAGVALVALVVVGFFLLLFKG